MKFRFTPIIFFYPWLCLFLFVCGKKEQKKEDIVIIGSDTISVEELSRKAPDTVLTPEKKRKLCLTIAVAKQMPKPKDTVTFNETVKDLTDQLSRESGRAWSKDAAHELYCASKMIKEKLENETDVTAVKSYLNTLAKKVKMPSDGSSYSINVDELFKDTLNADKKRQLSTVISSLFGADAHLSNVITNFLYSENMVLQESAGIDDLVKGLVYDSTSAPKEEKPKVKKRLVRRDNSALALKHRNQHSIKSTISEHIPYLEAIYKKELKIDPDMSGIIYVTFRVAPSGEVASAVIKTSEIRNSRFINPFLDHVKEIKFKSIPENVGNMTFDFPFEFKPQL